METNSLLQILGGVLEDRNIGQISGALGTDNAKTKKAIATALPALLGALSKNTSSEEGANSLDAALTKDHDGSMLSNMGQIIANPDALNANKILGHILGADTDTVAQDVAAKSGLGQKQSQDVLKTLAPVLLGALGKAKSEGNLSATDIAGLLTSSAGASNIFVKFLDTDGDGDFDKTDMLNYAIKYIKKNFFGK